MNEENTAEATEQPEGRGAGSKEAVLADLRQERTERQKLQQQVADLSKAVETATGFRDQLASLLGESQPDSDQPADMVTALQARMEKLEADNHVLSLVNTHKIVDQVDIDLIAAQPTREAMATLAARLKPTDGDQRPGTPKPDRSIGRGFGDDKGGTSSVAQAREAYRARRQPKTA